MTKMKLFFVTPISSSDEVIPERSKYLPSRKYAPMMKAYISTPNASIGSKVFLFGLKKRSIAVSLRITTSEIGIITKSASLIAAFTKYVGVNISSIADIAMQQAARAII